MSTTPEHFLKFASSALTNANGSEFDLRNSASRAYYAAFHCCYAERSKCPDLKDDEIRGSHDKLYARFEALPLSEENNILKTMAYVSKMMKTVRHNADYHINSNFSQSDSEQQIRDAQGVLRNWKKIQLNP